ncbi:MAG: DUF6252 family protein [Sphingobacteriaceae bacterium]
MKTTQNFKKGLTLFVLALFITLSGMQCEKDKNIPEIDKLPPPTQTGADTFGCLVDGKALLPRKKSWSGSGVLQCDYQYINSGNLNGYYFTLGGSDEKTYSNAIHKVILRANALELKEQTYVLDEYDIPGKLNGEFRIFSDIDSKYTTNQIYKGELTITNFDPVNYIISGTFWFDAINDKGEKVEVREGRFDVHYTL